MRQQLIEFWLKKLHECLLYFVLKTDSIYQKNKKTLILKFCKDLWQKGKENHRIK